MTKGSAASSSRTERVQVRAAEEYALQDESAALRQLLLELRPDLVHVREPAREARLGYFAEALAALGELAISTGEVEPLLGGACQLVIETLEVDGAAILEVSGNPERLVVRSGAGCLREAVGEACAAGPGTQVGFALSQHGSTATADARAAWMGDLFVARHELVASAVVVLPGAGGQRAVLGAYARQRRAFAPAEVRFLEAAAGYLASALARQRSDVERQELQARLALADRMVSVGTLAAGVAHELNNPLAYVNANLTFLTEQVAQLDSLLPAGVRADGEVADAMTQLVEAARDARDGAERMRIIVRDLRTLSRGDDSRVGPVEVGAILECCLNVAWSEIKHRAKVVRDLQPVPPVRGNEARLGQVFLNLLVNAAQAMPESGTESNQLTVSTRVLDGGRVAIEIGDTGCGIAPEILPQIFDPFFTTKPPGVGTGLGLSICRTIVAGLGGTIDVRSEPGQGTTFRVVLAVAVPISDAEADLAERAPTRPRASILVVDDEPLVGTVLQRTLGNEHQVILCGSGREALDRVAAGERFDLILSDLLMPDLTGMDLHREIARTDPVLAGRMVFLTGGAFTQAARDFLGRPGMECVEKPFDLEVIRAVIARRLTPT